MESSDRFDTYLLDADSDTVTEQGTLNEPSTEDSDLQVNDQSTEAADSDGVTVEVESGLIDDTFESTVKSNGHTDSDDVANTTDPAEQNPACETTTSDGESDTKLPAAAVVSPFRAATLSVADAIESAVSTSEHRHDDLQNRFETMAGQQAAADDKQQQLSRSVASIQSWQSQSDGRLNQLDLKQRAIIDSQKAISESVSSVLANQKTSAKCYNEVMAGLNAIQATQQFDQQRLDELTTQFDDRLAALRKSMVVGGVIIGILAAIAIVVGIL